MAGDTLVPGFLFPPREVCRDRDDQAEALRACAVDPDLWDGTAEPTLWGNDGFRAMSAAGQQIDGYIHVEHRLVVTGSVPLGEPVTFAGRTVSNETVPRGRHVVQRFEVTRGDGTVAVVSEHGRLLPDLEKMGTRRPGSAADETVPTEALAEKVLTPDAVTTYSRPVGNEIHFDPGFAARYGYRAPLAQGLMTLTWMASAVAERLCSAPRAELLARFRRPVFWDEPLSLVGERDADGELSWLCALNRAGRIACDLRVRIEG